MQSRQPGTPHPKDAFPSLFEQRQPMPDKLSKEQRSKLMSRIKSQDTLPERALRKALFAKGLRFRKNVRSLPGKPDIVFPRVRLAIFVHGDFWHGRNLRARRVRLPAKWVAKLENNRRRDAKNICQLRRCGWRVLVIWESALKANPAHCLARVLSAIRIKRSSTMAAAPSRYGCGALGSLATGLRARRTRTPPTPRGA